MVNLDNIKIKFFGRSKNTGGYAQATRYIAQGFAQTGIRVNFEQKTPFYQGLSSYSGKCNVTFIVGTPPFSRYKSNSYRIGYFYWETDKLPAKWAADIRGSVDELWVPCELTKQACRRAGFKGHIEVVFTPRPKKLLKSPVFLPAPNNKEFVISDDIFIFYSIFQWNERKGYKKLFRAFIEEFSGQEDVLLLVKTNPIDHYKHGLSKIRLESQSLKAFSRNKLPPKVFISTEILPEKEIGGIHDLGDCFVLPHHGEGWGMPIHDAMMHKSLVITTAYGGITEFLDSDSAYLVNHKLVPVSPMDWNPYYCQDQLWAEPDLNHLRFLMRKAYMNRGGGYDDLLFNAKSIASSMSIDSFSERIQDIFSSSRFCNIGGGT